MPVARTNFRWTPAADALARSARRAADVAAELGVSPGAVETRRSRLGYRMPADDFWTAERLLVLRDLTTVAAAARLGVTPSTVSRARKRHDIPGPPAAGGRTGRPKGTTGPGPKVLRLAARAKDLRAEGLTLAAVGERHVGVDEAAGLTAEVVETSGDGPWMLTMRRGREIVGTHRTVPDAEAGKRAAEAP